MGTQSGEIHPTNMIKLVAALCVLGSVSGSLVTYPNGAIVPVDPANQVATAAHLASKFTYGVYGHPLAYHHLGKRDADADASLVVMPTALLFPTTPTFTEFPLMVIPWPIIILASVLLMPMALLFPTTLTSTELPLMLILMPSTILASVMLSPTFMLPIPMLLELPWLLTPTVLLFL